MWVRCRCGQRHWGSYGAAGIVLRDRDGLLLMTHRGWLVQFPGTWAFPGGALEERETPVDAALREMAEETGVPASAAEVTACVTGTDHGVWRYTYVFADLSPQWTDFRVRPNWETRAVSWVAPTDMMTMTLHPDLRADLPILHTALGIV